MDGPAWEVLDTLDSSFKHLCISDDPVFREEGYGCPKLDALKKLPTGWGQLSWTQKLLKQGIQETKETSGGTMEIITRARIGEVNSNQPDKEIWDSHEKTFLIVSGTSCGRTFIMRKVLVKHPELRNGGSVRHIAQKTIWITY